MAANRFATYLHRKTNSRITLVLVYAFLEWSLIFFIFLNSLLSYFILRFADYFGLKRPCLLCSRIDRFFDSSGESPSHLDLLCRNHSLQVSNSKPPTGFVESLYSSSDDLMEKKSSEPDLWGIGYYNISRTLDLIGDDDGDDVQIHNGKLFTERSCSIFVLEEENVGSVLLKDSHDQRRQVEEDEEEEEEEDEEEEEVSSDSNVDDDEEFSCYMSSFDCNRDISVESKVDLAMEADDSPVESAPVKNLEFYIDDRDCHLIPVEEAREISDVNGDFILDFAAAEEKEEDGVSFPEETSVFTSPEELKPETNLDSSSDDNEEEVSIGTEIPDHGQIGDIPSSPKHITDTDVEEDGDHSTLEFKTVTIETKKPVFTINKDQDMLLETATMFESIECPEEGGVVLTVDKLKTELEEERKALNALYEELEEERSASAIAANETMAMINRLHEEKSAMQMEALQYQRMMEEQSEFDQEALQLLNELMVNRERENAELEKEIEVYRKRLDEYEAKEKMGMLRRKLSRRDSSVDSYRNNVDAEEEKNNNNNNNNGELHHKNVEEALNHEYKENEKESNTPVDVVLRLDECLDDYEGERLSILGRLKFLEEKLTSLNDEEDEEEAKTFENNGNGHFHGNGKHRVIKSKRLLPLFDAVDGEMEESNGNNHDENGFDESEKGGEIVTVEEEVDELYERLEALEADREFLRHCVGSLRKGDKGVHLLHEILQHLRDLKNIDLIRIRENQDITF